jgi:hypothetical protein
LYTMPCSKAQVSVLAFLLGCCCCHSMSTAPARAAPHRLVRPCGRS